MVDQSKIIQSANRMTQIIAENIETADTRKGGPLREIYIAAGSLVGSVLSEQNDALEQTNNLLAIEQNIDTVPDEAVDAVVSNWNVTRKSGSTSLGSIKISVNIQKQYFIPDDVAFSTASGLNYFAVTATTVPVEDVIEDVVSGTFYFFVSVRAEQAGKEYDIEAGTQLQTSILSGSLIIITAYNDFFNGSNSETSAELIARGKTLTSTRDLQSRTSINAFMQENFTSVKMVSVTGFQDIEMQRGMTSLGIKAGGPSDIYIKTDISVNSQEVSVTTDANGQFVVPSEFFPILRIQDFALQSDPINRIDVTNLIVGSSNQILEPRFARFTQYETITVDTGIPNANIVYTINLHPNIKVIDDFINADTRENLCSFMLVKSFIPVFVSTTIEFSVKSGADVADDDTIRQSLCDFINSINSGELYVSELIEVFHDFNIVNIELPLEITGIAYLPDGSTMQSSSANKLIFAPNIGLQFSENTYRFYCVKNDIDLIRNVV